MHRQLVLQEITFEWANPEQLVRVQGIQSQAIRSINCEMQPNSPRDRVRGFVVPDRLL